MIENALQLQGVFFMLCFGGKFRIKISGLTILSVKGSFFR